MLVLSRGPEEGIMIGEEVEVRVLEVRGDRVRLGIVAPPSVSVHRKEVFLSIRRENVAAVAAEASSLAGALDLLARGPAAEPEDRAGTGGRPPAQSGN